MCENQLSGGMPNMPNMDQPMDGGVAGETPQAGTLHVVFHGLFCFFERERDILARVPMIDHGGSMSSEHAYRAGNWLGEVTYAPGDYELKGVEPGYGRFPKKHNLVISGAVPAPNPGKALYAEMVFPYPDRIESIQTLPVDPNQVFAGGSLGQVQGVREIATLQVFTYRFGDHLKLMLDDHPWRAEKMMVGGFCALHLFAEPDRKMPTDMTKTHVKSAFGAAMKMYQNIDLAMVVVDKVKGVTIDQIPFGARIEEMEDLNIRLKRLADLGSMKKRGDNLNGLWELDESLDGSDVERCSHSIGVG